MLNIITFIPLPTTNTKNDKVAWGPRTSGKFDVKSAYRIISLPKCYFDLTLISWTKLWKNELSFKYKMLLWHLCHRILPVGTALKDKIQIH